MKIVAVAGQRKNRETKSAELVSALADKFDRSYHQSRDRASLPPDANLYIQYGFKRNAGLDAAMEKNIPYIILDRGYFEGNFPKCFSVSINGFHGLSMRYHHVNRLPPRPKPELKPWREPGEFTYIYGQMPGDRAARGICVETWLRREAQNATQALGKPVKIRPHPQTLNPWEPQLPPLEQTFEDAFCTVAYTTNAGTQSVINGVRHIALHPASPAWDVSAHSYAELDASHNLTRGEWLHDLSYRNYTHTETAKAANYIRKAYHQAATAALLGDYDTLDLRA